MNGETAAALLMEKIVRDAYFNKRSSAIQPLQWSILRFLSGSSGAPKNISAVAKYVGTTIAPASRAITTLEKKGLIAKTRNPQSLRSAMITITSKGTKALSRDPLLQIARRIASLEKEDREGIVRGLHKLALCDVA